LVCGGLILSLTLWFKLGMDQSIYCYGAWVWKHYHLPPYLGVWDLNFPGIFFLHRLILEIFGESILGFRFFDFLVQLSILVGIFYLGKKLSGSALAGFFSALFYSIYYYSLNFWGTGQREGFVFWLLLFTLMLELWITNKLWLRALFQGLFLGFAFLIKPTYGLSWLIFGAGLLWELRQKKEGIWKEMGLFVFALLFFPFLILLYYFTCGGLRELYLATIWYNFEIYARLKPSGFYLVSFLREEPLLMVFGFLGVYYQFLDNRKQEKWFWLGVFLIFQALFSFLVQGKYLVSYHLIPFFGLMCLFSGPALMRLAQSLLNQSQGKVSQIGVRIFYLLVLILMVAGVGESQLYFAFKYCFRHLEPAYLAQIGTPADRLLTQNYQLANYLKLVIKDQEQIGLFSQHPLLAYLLKKKLPSRFVCVQHLLFSPSRKRLTEQQKKWIEEYTEAIIKASPRFFILLDYQILFPIAVSEPSLGRAFEERFPALRDFIFSHYQLWFKSGKIQIYRKNRE